MKNKVLLVLGLIMIYVVASTLEYNTLQRVEQGYKPLSTLICPTLQVTANKPDTGVTGARNTCYSLIS